MNEKSNFYNSLHQYKLSRVATLNIILRTYTIVRASLVIKIANKFFISLTHSPLAFSMSVQISVTSFYSSTNYWRCSRSKSFGIDIRLFFYSNFSIFSLLFLVFVIFEIPMSFFLNKSFNFMFIFNL